MGSEFNAFSFYPPRTNLVILLQSNGHSIKISKMLMLSISKLTFAVIKKNIESNETK